VVNCTPLRLLATYNHLLSFVSFVPFVNFLLLEGRRALTGALCVLCASVVKYAAT